MSVVAGISTHHRKEMTPEAGSKKKTHIYHSFTEGFSPIYLLFDLARVLQV